MFARVVLLLLLAPGAAAQVVHHVDDDALGANDGSSWQDAFVDLQDALSVSVPGDEIWVAEGTYLPSGTGDRTASFRPGTVTRLFGGFDGTETTFDQRAGLFDETILSGDLAGDDGPNFSNRADNSEHVVAVGSAAGTDLDGFTLRGGNAVTGPGGGAWYAEPLSCARARRCTFVDNEGVAGGAVWSSGDSVDSFTECRFLGNRAEEGGAVFGEGGVGYLSFNRCLFQGNVATVVGGGAISSGWVDVWSSVLLGNSADGTSLGGGAMLGFGTLAYSSVHANSALGGNLVGGVSGFVSVKGSILWGNADDRGEVAAAQFRSVWKGWDAIETSCVQGWSPPLGGTGLLSSNPEFVDPLGPDGVAGSLDDDLHLARLSPCVDRLPFINYYPTDFDGRPRNVDAESCDAGVADLGAFERQTIDGAPRFCPATPSSLGVPAELRAPCAADFDAGPIALSVHPVPAGAGLLLLGPARTRIPFGDGVLCLAGGILRTPLVPTTGDTLFLSFDPALIGDGALAPGTTWNLQALYFDAGGSAGFNLSDAIAITY